MKITWLGQAGLLFETDTCTVMLDPYLSDSVEKIQPQNYRRTPIDRRFFEIFPDVMIFTHDHLDHYDPETASHFLKRNEKRITVLSPSSVWQKVRAEAIGHNCVEFNSGSEWTEGHLRFTAVPAEHSDRWSIGVLIEELTEHKTYYVTGDTLYHARIFSAIPASVDVVFLPVNGVGNNMNLTDAARFANRIGAKTVVPIHFGMFDELSPCGMEVANCIIPTPYQEISI